MRGKGRQSDATGDGDRPAGATAPATEHGLPVLGDRRLQFAVAYLVAAIALTVVACWRPPELRDDEVGWRRYGLRLLYTYGKEIRSPGTEVESIWAEPCEHYGSNNPRVGTFIVGAISTWEKDAAAARRMFVRMGLLSAATAALFFLLCAARNGALTGAVGFLLLLTHPLFYRLAVELRPDAPLMLFAVGTMWSIETLEKTHHRRHRYLLAAATTGIWFGLAISTKLYAVALALPLIAAFGWHGRWQRWWTVPLAFLSISVISAAIFVASNPLLWSEPMRAMTAMTTGHLAETPIVPLGGKESLQSLKLLATLPFTSEDVLPIPLPIKGFPHPQHYPYLIAGIALFAVGLYAAIRARRGTALAFLAGTFALHAWVVGTHPFAWTIPRTFLLPTLAVVWIEALGISQMATWIGGALSTKRR